MIRKRTPPYAAFPSQDAKAGTAVGEHCDEKSTVCRNGSGQEPDGLLPEMRQRRMRLLRASAQELPEDHL